MAYAPLNRMLFAIDMSGRRARPLRAFRIGSLSNQEGRSIIDFNQINDMNIYYANTLGAVAIRSDLRRGSRRYQIVSNFYRLHGWRRLRKNLGILPVAIVDVTARN
jgi:hypothetical protein